MITSYLYYLNKEYFYYAIEDDKIFFDLNVPILIPACWDKASSEFKREFLNSLVRKASTEKTSKTIWCAGGSSSIRFDVTSCQNYWHRGTEGDYIYFQVLDRYFQFSRLRKYGDVYTGRDGFPPTWREVTEIPPNYSKDSRVNRPLFGKRWHELWIMDIGYMILQFLSDHELIHADKVQHENVWVDLPTGRRQCGVLEIL